MSDLGVLLGAILNQDWTDDYPTVWAAVDYFCSSPERETVMGAHAELVDLLAKGLSENALLDVLLDDYDSGYWPPGDDTTATGFLTRLECELRT